MLGDLGSIPGSGRAPGEGNGSPSTLAWRIPWTEEAGRLQSMGSLGVGHDWGLHFHFSLSCAGEGNGNPLQCSCLENPRDGGAWWAAVYGVAQSWTRLKRLSSSSSSKNKLTFANDQANLQLVTVASNRINTFIESLLHLRPYAMHQPIANNN